MPGKFTFYSEQILGDKAVFDSNETGHAIRTLRYKTGDIIHFTDGLGKLYDGEILEAGKHQFVAEILKFCEDTLRPAIHVFVGILKSGDRMEWIVEKCTELGVAGIWFVKTANSERASVNEAKLKKTAIAAMKQSHRSWLPDTGVLNLHEALKAAKGDKLVAHISGKAISQLQLNTPVSLLFGPEGDFTEKELSEIAEAGFNAVKLGDAVLRTETAAIAAVAGVSLLNV